MEENNLMVLKIKNLLFIAFFSFSGCLIATTEAPIEERQKQLTETEKTEYLIQSLVPQESQHCTALEILGLFCGRVVFPLVCMQYLENHSYIPKLKIGVIKGLTMGLGLTAFNFGDALLADEIQNAFIADKKFQSSVATLLTYSPGAYIWSLIHKYYYNQERFLNKVLEEFKHHPEDFPQASHALLQEALVEKEPQKKIVIYYKLIELAQPTLKKLKAMESLLWHQKEAHLNGLTELEQKAKEEYDRIKASMD